MANALVVKAVLSNFASNCPNWWAGSAMAAAGTGSGSVQNTLKVGSAAMTSVLGAAADVAFIVLLMYASGGIASGIGLLLLAALAGASLISRGRLALFHAAVASIAVLLEHTYEVLAHDSAPALFVQAGFLSIGYFATAWLAFMLARYKIGRAHV